MAALSHFMAPCTFMIMTTSPARKNLAGPLQVCPHH